MRDDDDSDTEQKRVDKTSKPKRERKAAPGDPKWATRKTPPFLTVTDYNALWHVYADEPDYRKAAKAVGVKVAVARWYCEGPAHPERGLRQLAMRLKEVQRSVTDLVDHGTAKLKQEQAATFLRMLKVTAGLAEVHGAALVETAEAIRRRELTAVEAAERVPLRDVVSAHDKAFRGLMLALGEADQAVSVVDAPTPLNFAEWTAEECEAYHERGAIPAREKK